MQEKRNLPAKVVNGVPIISAENYSHVGRYAGALVLACFEQIGGLERFASWADTAPTDYYTKIFPKMISKSQQIDVTGSITIDDAISAIEGDFVEVERDYDL